MQFISIILAGEILALHVQDPKFDSWSLVFSPTQSTGSQLMIQAPPHHQAKALNYQVQTEYHSCHPWVPKCPWRSTPKKTINSEKR